MWRTLQLILYGIAALVGAMVTIARPNPLSAGLAGVAIYAFYRALKAAPEITGRAVIRDGTAFWCGEGVSLKNPDSQTWKLKSTGRGSVELTTRSGLDHLSICVADLKKVQRDEAAPPIGSPQDQSPYLEAISSAARASASSVHQSATITGPTSRAFRGAPAYECVADWAAARLQVKVLTILTPASAMVLIQMFTHGPDHATQQGEYEAMLDRNLRLTET